MIKYILFLATILGVVYQGNCALWTAKFKYYLVPHGQTALLTCKIEGDFDGFYDKTGTKINASSKYKIEKQSDTSYVLDILNVEESDYGNYKCKDTTSEDEATLEVDIKLEKLEAHNLAIGFEGQIVADVYGMPRKQIEWLHGTQKIAVLDPSGQMIMNEKDRYNIDVRGSLIIKKVIAEDKGTYTINVIKEGARISEKVEIDVGLKPSIAAPPDASYTKTSGQELKLPCNFKDGDAKPTWEFTKKGSDTPVQIDAFKVSDSGYTIPAVSPDNEGKYTCTSKNTYGTTTVNTEITQVILPAEITSDFQNTKQVIGKSFDIVCNASGTPVPTVELVHNEKVVNSGAGSAKLSITIAKENVGDYKCTADNGATKVDGSSMKVEKTMNIEMLTPAVLTEETTSTVTSAVGLSFSVKCVATGNPLPTITLQQDGKDVVGVADNTATTAKLTYDVKKATKEDMKDFTCTAKNPIGSKNGTVKVVEVVKAKPPANLKQSGPAGLKYIVLSWKESDGADSYVVYVNETLKKIPTDKTELQIPDLKQNTIYKFSVASVNLAGEGNRATIVLATSNINAPGNVTNVQASDQTTSSALVRWDPPSSEQMDILYRIIYCKLNNGTLVDCQSPSDQKDDSIQLDGLEPGTSYVVEIAALNQKLAGHTVKYTFTTKEEVITPKPAPAEEKKGMSAGVIAGIIVAIILIILLVVDLFCCFFNHCGFTHCCVETFCSSKAAKYQPTETKENDKEEMEELKPKQEPKEDIV